MCKVSDVKEKKQRQIIIPHVNNLTTGGPTTVQQGEDIIH